LNEDDTRVIAIGTIAFNKGHCVAYSFPECESVYTFEYNIKKFKKGALTMDGSFLAVPGSDKSGDVLGVYHAKTGTHLYNLQLKYGDYKELTALRAMPHDPNQIVVVDEFKGNILDLKRKTLVRSVNRWNGMAMKTGKHGLFAVSRGGLELLELKSGKTIRTFIPRVAEGVFSIDAGNE
jgi:hypothetical protein